MPRTLAQNAQYIAETIKPAIKSAIEAQGVTVPSTDSFLDYADRIGEISGGGSGYQLKDLPTGSISTVSDAEALPLNALTVSVEAWQEGSGDPSPSNVRPIHGWDSGEIWVVGKNQADISDVASVYINQNASTVGSPITYVNSSASVTYKKIGKVKANTSYVLSWQTNGTPASTGYRNGVITDGGGIVRQNNIPNWEPNKNYVKITPTVSGFLYIVMDVSATNIQLEEDNQATAYEPYSGTTTTHQFTDSQGNPLTCYGGEWNVVEGELKQTDGYIASYNGETLPDTWISDRDVYASGTTPTTGAEVVYKLATPTTIPQQPEVIRLLEGVNNLFADCGEVLEGEYFIGSSGAYDLVEYIESDGTQVIDTGRQVVSGQTIEVTFEGSSNQTAYAWIFGGITSSDYYGYQFPNSSTVYLYNGGTSASSQSGFASDMITQKALTFNGSANANIHILGLWDGSAYSNQGKFKVYFLDIDGDYFVPAKRRSDGVYGLYDIVNSQFLTDVASGNPLTGGASLGIRIG